MDDAKIRCLFCRTTTGKRSGEHVLRQWFKGRIETYESIRLYRTGGANGPLERGQPTTPFDQIVNEVCRDCNQGWLNDLETSVGGFLVDFANNRTTTFPEEFTEPLAMWCVTRALLRAQTDKADNQQPDPDTFHRVWEERKPPSGSRVHVARCDAYLHAGGSNTSRNFRLRDNSTGELMDLRGSRVNIVTFGLGAFFFQVGLPSDSKFARRTSNRYMDAAADAFPGRFTRLWPFPNVQEPALRLTASEAQLCGNLPALLGEAEYLPGPRGFRSFE